MYVMRSEDIRKHASGRLLSKEQIVERDSSAKSSAPNAYAG